MALPSLPGTPTLVPQDGSEPCSGGSRPSQFARSLRRLRELGVPASALASPFTLVHTSANRLHASCARPSGARSVSVWELSSLSFCACVDELLEYDSGVMDLVMALDSFKDLTSDLRSVKGDPVDVLEQLTAIEDELDYQIECPDFSVPKEAFRARLRAEGLRAARRLRSSAVFASAYARVSLQVVEELTLESDFFSDADLELLLGEAPSPSEAADLVSAMVESWTLGSSRSERLALALEAAEYVLASDLDLDPATLRFVPASPPAPGALVLDWLLAERAAARTRVLSSFVASLEAQLSVPVSEPGALVVVPQSCRGDLDADLLLVLDGCRLASSSSPVSLVPRHVGEWARMLVEDADGGEVVLLDGAPPQVVETALALWDSCADGPLTSLAAALEAARRV